MNARTQCVTIRRQAITQQLLAAKHIEQLELDDELVGAGTRQAADDDDFGTQDAPVTKIDLCAGGRCRGCPPAISARDYPPIDYMTLWLELLRVGYLATIRYLSCPRIGSIDYLYLL